MAPYQRLTKSEYLLGRTCPTKVLHSRAGLPVVGSTDPFMQDLADVGAIIHWMAPRMYGAHQHRDVSIHNLPEGTIGAFAEVDIFSEFKHVRADILHVSASAITMAEFKSEKIPVDSKTGEVLPCLKDDGTIRSEWHDLIYDIAYQFLVLVEARVEGTVPIWNQDRGMEDVRLDLVLLNPEFESSWNDVRQNFIVDRATHEVSYRGNEADLLSANLLIPVDVTDIVYAVIQDVNKEAIEIHRALDHGAPPVLHSRCAKCEFQGAHPVSGDSGRALCWGELLYQEPFILDLAEVGRVKPIGGEDAVTVLTSEGKARMTDLPLDVLSPGYSHRQRRQVEVARTGTPIIDPALPEALASHPYPHVFIDVEAIASGLPYWPGCLPYEKTTFQWSAHTVHEPLTLASQPHHAEWLHESLRHPAIDFLRSIMDAVKGAGTIYIWSSYEKSAVQTAARAAIRHGGLPLSIAEWVDWFTGAGNPVVVDMLHLARNYYMHPLMKGSASIKRVLRGIWTDHADIRHRYPEYIRVVDGALLSPYEALPSLHGVAGLGDVREGTAAIHAYAALMFNPALSDDEKQAIRTALLAYCKLDTAAMVMIHEGWSTWPKGGM